MELSPLASSPVQPDRSERRRLLFLVTEDWFFASHFLPMARAAVSNGFDVAVVTRVRKHRKIIEACGARVIAFEAERRSLDPFAALREVRRLTLLLQAERPDIVHAIALRPILAGGLACVLAGIPRRVYALTGLGFIGATRGASGTFALALLRLAISKLLRSSATVYLFENRADPRRLGLDPAASNVVILGGAGVDPERLPPLPLPGGKTLRVALVSRMLWSKGVDVAVEAVRIARREGVDVTLSLFGEPDPSNPRSIDEATLSGWSRRDGVEWHGRTEDVGAVWAEHHVALLPSRGGEGLPRSLLEAAACGRAVIASDVPGCRDFVRDGIEGFLVPTDDPTELARAIATLAEDRWLAERLGAAARRRLEDGHTERDVEESVQALYRRMLQSGA